PLTHTLSLHDALPISEPLGSVASPFGPRMGLTPPHHDAVEGARLLDLDVLLAEQFEEGEEPHHHVGTACRLAAEVAEGHGPAPLEFLGQYLDHLGDADAHRGDVRRIHG